MKDKLNVFALTVDGISTVLLLLEMLLTNILCNCFVLRLLCGVTRSSLMTFFYLLTPNNYFEPM
jgi:NADH:ubiquinone oxidoreductase subunit 4 (subunit M)